MADVGQVGGLGGLAHPTDTPQVAGPQQAKTVDPQRVLNREMRRSEREALHEFQQLQRDTRLNMIAGVLRFMKRAKPVSRKKKEDREGRGRRPRPVPVPTQAEEPDEIDQAASNIAGGADPKSTIIELIATSDNVNVALSDLKRAITEKSAPRPIQVAAMESIVQGRIDFMQPEKAEETTGLRQRLGDLVGRDVLKDMTGNLKRGMQAHELLSLGDIDLAEE